MSYGLRRVLGWIALPADIGFMVYLVYGPPHDWEDGKKWLYRALMLASLAGVHLIVKLIFPGTGDEETPDGDRHGDDADDRTDLDRATRRDA
ncbi:hypothetical protein [Streptomyces sp. NPDC006334]|uniref:hypothetical protein n=1 Tax=Streptomyces sp. NPDC006334 TaxID=3156754 RepID=UPI0033AAC712